MVPYYKTSDGKVVELEQVDLEQQDILNLCCEDIVELVIPDGYKRVWCNDNKLKELIIPDECKYVRCWNSQLKELIIPDGCEEVEADMKSVTVLNKVEGLYLTI